VEVTPLILAELIPHDSRLQFCNHIPGDAVNRKPGFEFQEITGVKVQVAPGIREMFECPAATLDGK
jgi:hypothetical protein